MRGVGAVMIELIEQGDCVKVIYHDGSNRWRNIYPGEVIEVPADLTTEQKAELDEMLARCETRFAEVVEVAQAENQAMQAELDKIQAEEDAKYAAEIRRQLIAAGVIKP